MAPVREWVFLAILLVLRGTAALQALSVTPSTQWYGDDGTWSAVQIRVGTPPQWADVMVNTVSSETWVVGPSGCKDNNSICTSARGGIYDSSKSSTSKDLGLYSLGVDTRLNMSGYADYGFDALTFGSTGVTLNSTIIGSINTTEFFLGMLGVGVVAGSFNNTPSVAAISALVEKNAAIPSNSYGYTAGATYQQKGVPNSLTLGGYDANRFEPHNTTFNLNPSKFPETYIDSIHVYSTTPGSNWSTPVKLLSSTDRVTAIIDSSTPYLWLPQSVCDNFAQTLGLTYNSTLDLYTFDGNASRRDALRNADMTFNVTLSDTSSAPDTINIVLPYAAFDQQLSFPSIPNTTYGTPAASKYYFPIKRASGAAQYTIGRVFLQEAYLITDYERNTYSVHQAVHTSDPIQNTSIVSINRPSDSTFSSPPGSGSRSGNSKSKMAIGAIIGIVVGVVVLFALSAFIIFYFCRRKKKRNATDDEKPPETTQSRGFLARFRRQPREPPANEAIGSTAYPTEVGADASHARFELPAPLGPAELDSEAGTLSGTTEAGSSTTDSNNMSAYERARRKLERQQVAAGHAQSTHETYPVEKNENDTVQYLSPPDNNSNFSTPMVSPVAGSGTSGSMTASGQPSPVSPHFASNPTSPTSPPPTYRRISPSNVVYAGRLPDNVQLPNVVPRMLGRDGQPAPQEQTLLTEPGSSSLGSQYTENQTSGSREEDIYSAPSSRSVASAAAYSPVSPPSTASAPTGSNSGISDISGGSGSSQQPLRPFREEDESKFLREDMLALRADMQTREMVDPYRGKTRLGGEDLVHVPVQAERRFSWEEGGTL